MVYRGFPVFVTQDNEQDKEMASAIALNNSPIKAELSDVAGKVTGLDRHVFVICHHVGQYVYTSTPSLTD